MTDEATTLERSARIGPFKVFIFKIIDGTKEAITLDLTKYFNHIFWADIHDITTAVYVSATWSDGEETITIGNEFTASDVLELIVIGS